LKIKWIRRYQRILNEIEEEAKSHPRYADLQCQLGILLLIKGETRRSEDHLKKALQINPNYEEALLHLGYLYLMTKKSIPLKEGFFNPIRRRKGEWIHALFALFHLQMGRKKEALSQAQKAISLEGKGWRSRKRKVEWDEELKSFLQALLFKNLLSRFYYLMAHRLSRRGRFREAVEELKRAHRVKSNEFLFHFYMGGIYFDQGAYRKAIGHYRKAIQLQPRDGMSHAHLGLIYGILRRPREALKWMKKAVTLNPTYADLHYHLGLLYSDQKRYPEAMEELRRAIRINPNYLFARINLGVLYEEQGKMREAKREYQKVLRITPEDEYVRKRLERISSRRR
jgi:tetratricopeptide (TPR) repeat protein